MTALIRKQQLQRLFGAAVSAVSGRQALSYCSRRSVLFGDRAGFPRCDTGTRAANDS